MTIFEGTRLQTLPLNVVAWALALAETASAARRTTTVRRLTRTVVSFVRHRPGRAGPLPGRLMPRISPRPGAPMELRRMADPRVSARNTRARQLASSANAGAAERTHFGSSSHAFRCHRGMNTIPTSMRRETRKARVVSAL